MKVEYHSYRYAEEILQHSRYRAAWDEIDLVLETTPLFIYPGKSRNTRLDVVQQVINTYFDRRFAVDLGWEHHPLATGIADSGLEADYRKSFGGLTIQVEVQFGNMARWYSDIFKFQTAYSQSLIQIGLCVIPMGVLARRIDSNVVNFERAVRELPAAELSITLPILIAGLEPDEHTPVVDLRESLFADHREITGRGHQDNQWRLVNGHLAGTPTSILGPESDTGPMVSGSADDES
ncbi:MAG: hypothetical protein JXA74_01155 [Anaerolineae bacterium]|nr:hypothetical protein [Anaerolineae bacterium]